MNLDEFVDSLEKDAPPEILEDVSKALWHDRKGDWDRAHRIVQEIDSAEAAWVHAYLHRREGDLGNAGYWYRRAGKPPSELTLEQEWEEITGRLLKEEA